MVYSRLTHIPVVASKFRSARLGRFLQLAASEDRRRELYTWEFLRKKGGGGIVTTVDRRPVDQGRRGWDIMKKTHRGNLLKQERAGSKIHGKPG